MHSAEQVHHLLALLRRYAGVDLWPLAASKVQHAARLRPQRGLGCRAIRLLISGRHSTISSTHISLGLEPNRLSGTHQPDYLKTSTVRDVSYSTSLRGNSLSTPALDLRDGTPSCTQTTSTILEQVVHERIKGFSKQCAQIGACAKTLRMSRSLGYARGYHEKNQHSLVFEFNVTLDCVAIAQVLSGSRKCLYKGCLSAENM